MNTETQEPPYSPSDYHGIMLWGAANEDDAQHIRSRQAFACREGAPVDAIYHTSDKTWRTVSDLASGHEFREEYEAFMSSLQAEGSNKIMNTNETEPSTQPRIIRAHEAWERVRGAWRATVLSTYLSKVMECIDKAVCDTPPNVRVDVEELVHSLNNEQRRILTEELVKLGYVVTYTPASESGMSSPTDKYVVSWENAESPTDPR
jgi:hypothetical protein